MDPRRRHARLRAISCVALAWAALACGNVSQDSSSAGNASGGGGSGGGAGGGACAPESPAATDPTALIDDMEDQNPRLSMVSGLNGGWWPAGDATPGATMVPAIGTDANPEAIPGGRCASRYAMRITGQGFDDWGAELGLTFASDASGAVPYDAHSRHGVTFFARIGDTSTDRIRLGIGDKYADPAGGQCMVGGSPGTGCYDSFGVYLPRLDTNWQKYEIAFSSLSQRNFGLQRAALDSESLYWLIFAVDAGSIFDFWVDDIAFY